MYLRSCPIFDHSIGVVLEQKGFLTQHSYGPALPALTPHRGPKPSAGSDFRRRWVGVLTQAAQGCPRLSLFIREIRVVSDWRFTGFRWRAQGMVCGDSFQCPMGIWGHHEQLWWHCLAPSSLLHSRLTRPVATRGPKCQRKTWGQRIMSGDGRAHEDIE